MRRLPFLGGLLFLCAQPALALADKPALSIAVSDPDVATAAAAGSLTWAPGSGPDTAANANTPAAPSPQTPAAQMAPVKSQPVPVPRAAVQAPAAVAPEIHYHFHYAPATVAAPVMASAQSAPVFAAQAVVQQPVFRRAGPLRRGFGHLAGELAKIGWDRTLTPPAPKPAKVVMTSAPVYYVPTASADTAAPPPPMAPVKATPQQ